MKEEKITITNAQELRQEKCNVPTLRFCEFTLPWKRIELKSIIKEIKQYTSDFDKYPLYSFTIENGVTPKTDRYERNFLVTKEGDTFKVVPPNTFVMNPMNLRFGAINYSKLDFPVSVSGYYNIFEIENGKNNDFWAAYFLTKSAINLYNSVATGSLIEKKRVHFSQFIGLKFLVPTSKEKEKITYFIRLIDKRLAVQNKIISKYETLIKGIRHRIFGSICGERQSSLGSFLEEYSEKNIANNLQSVAVGKYGIRKREEIYSKELSTDYSKNKVIRKDTLIIGMGSTQIDIGILTTDDCYCVSPAYTTYRIKGVNSFYLQEYLIELNPLLSVRYMITSARQGKAVNKEALMKHLMTVHSENKQKEICQCFENLYSRLQIEKEMLSALQKQKAFLLQSMFI